MIWAEQNPLRAKKFATVKPPPINSHHHTNNVDKSSIQRPADRKIEIYVESKNEIGERIEDKKLDHFNDSPSHQPVNYPMDTMNDRVVDSSSSYLDHNTEITHDSPIVAIATAVPVHIGK